MKIPPRLAPRSLLVATAIACIAVLQACQTPGGGGPSAPYVFEFHYTTQPNHVSLEEAQRFLRILKEHHVRGKLTLNGVPVSLPQKIRTDGVAMALHTKDPVPSGSWKTQLVGLLEANKEKDLKGALHEFSAPPTP